MHGSSGDTGSGIGSPARGGVSAPESPAPGGAERRPYEAPAIEETSDFETLALACAGSPVLCDPEDPVEPQEPSS
jgi:hypothetical protein